MAELIAVGTTEVDSAEFTLADGAGNNVWQPDVYGWSETDPSLFTRVWNWITSSFL